MSQALRELRELGQAAAAADDAALARVVAVLDRVPERGEADRVLDPVRPRLRTLRVPRPLGLPRLLFLPLDGVILPPARWTRGAAAVPRSALMVLAGAVQAALGAEGAAIAAACPRHTIQDDAAIAALGGRLWEPAARLLPEAPPPGWPGIGLNAGDYAGIAALCRPVWRAGPAIWAALSAAAEGPPEALARPALTAAAAGGAGPLTATLATLLLRATAPGLLAQLAAGLEPAARPVALAALDSILAAPPPPFAALDVRAAAEAARLTARRLEDLENCSLLTGEWQRRIQACRRVADEACRAAFLAATEQELVAPAQRLAAAPAVGDTEVAAMEEGARRLRVLEGAGRRLGNTQAYDRALRDLTASLRALGAQATNPEGLRPMDLARSLEILAGPEAAATLLPPGLLGGTEPAARR
ncbi:hypothetical protein [Roseicella aquatilis]|uniref:Uncharacterized protein n=1 Tax=Roseicella aquatilis TaxID=2527868 RepID=A0A4R4DS54_9PROT|nr:hypothetical protein [Roseicella aquatilis]TCZ64402.1 hypothetical protein EXY23_07075 [Roseicella aquatilis]